MTGIPVAAGEVVGIDYLNEVARGHWRDTALVDIVSSTTETDLLGASGVTVPANTLGTQRKLRISLIADIFNNTGVNADGVTLKVYYGGSSVASDLLPSAANANRKLIRAKIEIAAETASNAQAVAGSAFLYNSGLSSNVIAAFPASNSVKGWTDLAIDATVDQTLRLTATLNANNALLEFRKRIVVVEVV